MYLFGYNIHCHTGLFNYVIIVCFYVSNHPLNKRALDEWIWTRFVILFGSIHLGILMNHMLGTSWYISFILRAEACILLLYNLIIAFHPRPKAHLSNEAAARHRETNDWCSRSHYHKNVSVKWSMCTTKQLPLESIFDLCKGNQPKHYDHMAPYQTNWCTAHFVNYLSRNMHHLTFRGWLV